MSCEKEIIPVTLKRGSDSVIRIYLTDEDTGLPTNLTTASAIEVAFPGLTAPVIKSLGSGVAVVSPATGGAVDVTILKSDIDLMPLSDEQNIDARVTDTGKSKIASFPGQLNVRTSFFNTVA